VPLPWPPGQTRALLLANTRSLAVARAEPCIRIDTSHTSPFPRLSCPVLSCPVLSCPVLSGPAAADWPSRITEASRHKRASEEIHDGDRATQCPDQGLAPGDHGALGRRQPLAGVVSGHDGAQRHRSLPRKSGQGRL